MALERAPHIRILRSPCEKEQFARRHPERLSFIYSDKKKKRKTKLRTTQKQDEIYLTFKPLAWQVGSVANVAYGHRVGESHQSLSKAVGWNSKESLLIFYVLKTVSKINPSKR